MYFLACMYLVLQNVAAFGRCIYCYMYLSLQDFIFHIPLSFSPLISQWQVPGCPWLGDADLPDMGAQVYLGAGLVKKKPLDVPSTHLHLKEMAVLSRKFC